MHHDFDRALVANLFNAHRWIQFANTKALGDEAKEYLFKAYFAAGKDMCDTQALLQLPKNIGLNETEVCAVMHSDAYADEIQNDTHTAPHNGVTGVLFFVFNREYAVSWAQPSLSF